MASKRRDVVEEWRALPADRRRAVTERLIVDARDDDEVSSLAENGAIGDWREQARDKRLAARVLAHLGRKPRRRAEKPPDRVVAVVKSRDWDGLCPDCGRGGGTGYICGRDGRTQVWCDCKPPRKPRRPK